MSRRFPLLVALVETVLFCIGFLLAGLIRLDYAELISHPFILLKALNMAVFLQACLFYNDLYDFRSVTPMRSVVSRLIGGQVLAVLLLAVLYFILPDLAVGRGVFLLAQLTCGALFLSWRLILTKAIGGKVRTRILIMGTGKLAAELAGMIKERRPLGYQLVGVLKGAKEDRRQRALEAEATPPPARRAGEEASSSGELDAVTEDIVGTTDQLKEVCRRTQAHIVVVAMQDRRGNMPVSDLLDLKFQGVEVVEGVSLYERFTEKIYLTEMKPSWMIFSSGFRRSDLRKVSKRVLDLVAASFGLVVAAIPMAITALLVKITSPGPAIYAQERVGEFGRVFTLYKFRSMRTDSEKAGPQLAAKVDPRVTRFGNFIRKTRLDELPQLFNVLKGDMSLVGPRPERPYFVVKLQREIPFFRQRLFVKPGVTGLAQVKFRYAETTDDSLQKLQYDLAYIKNMGIMYDIQIILETIKVMVFRRGAH